MSPPVKGLPHVSSLISHAPLCFAYGEREQRRRQIPAIDPTKQRRGRDLNPGGSFWPPNSLAVSCIRPLCHLSIRRSTAFYSGLSQGPGCSTQSFRERRIRPSSVPQGRRPGRSLWPLSLGQARADHGLAQDRRALTDQHAFDHRQAPVQPLVARQINHRSAGPLLGVFCADH